MKSYKIYEVDDKISAKGNAYKKLVLQEPGAQYPLKNVTMFVSHPLFEDIAVGQTVELDVEVKDSPTPNPKGGFYKNRTVLSPGQTHQKPDQSPALNNPATAELKNILMFKVIPLLQGLSKDVAIMTEKMKMNPPYPDMDETNDSGGITENDVPF